jgi:hypothetical protein
MKATTYGVECTDGPHGPWNYHRSVTAAAEWYGVSPRDIRDCLAQKRPTVLGLRWRWADVNSRLEEFIDATCVAAPTLWRDADYMVTRFKLLAAYKAYVPRRWRKAITMDGMMLRLADLMLGEFYVDNLYWK